MTHSYLSLDEITRQWADCAIQDVPTQSVGTGCSLEISSRCLLRVKNLAPLLPGAQAIVYDTALRGVHHQETLRELGLVPINRVAAHSVSRSGKKARRVEKSRFIEDR